MFLYHSVLMHGTPYSDTLTFINFPSHTRSFFFRKTLTVAISSFFAGRKIRDKLLHSSVKFAPQRAYSQNIPLPPPPPSITYTALR